MPATTLDHARDGSMIRLASATRLADAIALAHVRPGITAVALDLDLTLVRPGPDRRGPQALLPMEPDTAKQVARLQREGVTVFGLTKRLAGRWGPDHAWRDRTATTDRDLLALGLDLSLTAPRLRDADARPGSHSAYHEGIAFAGPSPKGVLLEFLHDAHPLREVVLIDDLMENLIDVGRACMRMGVPFVGVHYTRGSAYPEEDAADLAFGQAWARYITALTCARPHFDTFAALSHGGRER